jgi:hypothetical protein
MTPYEAWTGQKPDVAHLREFGCDVWVLDESKNRSKLSPKSKKMKFTGFMDGSKSIRYYDAATRSIKMSRNFAFNENDELRELEIYTEVPGLQAEGETEPSDDFANPETPNTPIIETQPPTPDNTTTITETPTRPVREGRKDLDYRVINNPRAQPSRHVPTQTVPLNVSRPTAASSARRRPRETTHIAHQSVFDALTRQNPEDPEWLPQTREEAIKCDEGSEWEKAIDEEYNQLIERGTWHLEELPIGREAIGCKWVFDRKKDEKGNIVKYKARLVAQGFSQKPGVDYMDSGTFAPVMRFETLRTMLALATINRWDVRQMDVKGAYLNGWLKEEIYMKQPAGYDDGSGRVCRLIKTLYGLKQAGNEWNNEFDGTMKDLAYTNTRSDYCCYIRRQGENFAIVLVWVDDLVVFTNSPAESDRVEHELKQKFEIKTLGEPSLLLGMKITRDKENQITTLSQAHYVDKILHRVGLQDANPVSTPLDPNVNLETNEAEQDESGNDREFDHDRASGIYARAIGSLMYAAIGTRPDITYAVHTLAKFTKSPQSKHWTAIKRIFRYLKGTRDFHLTYGGPEHIHSTEISIYCDADWASSTDRKSISGYVFLLAGGAVSWSSKKQATVALSTAEAEYVAATHAAKQVLWHRALFDELEISQPETSILFSDNQAAISISHHPEFHARTKHIDIAHHFLRDLVESGTIEIIYIQTRENLADIFTKGLPRPLHEDLTTGIGVISDQGGVLE